MIQQIKKIQQKYNPRIILVQKIAKTANSQPRNIQDTVPHNATLLTLLYKTSATISTQVQSGTAFNLHAINYNCKDEWSVNKANVSLK